MEIEIWSDVVCPWCYIGTTNLRKALAAERTKATLHFRSFQLDPSAPAIPVPTLEHLTAKYGPDAAVMMDRVTEVAAAAGLEFHLDRSWSGQTVDAHRLLHHAAQEGLQLELADRFFAAQFTQGRSLFDHASLVELAAEVGLDAAKSTAVLEGDDYAAAVADDIAQAGALGVTGVPFFVFERRLAVSGAQPVELFGQVLREVNG